jgi:hypothetical protein
MGTEIIPIGKNWEYHRHIVLWRQEGEKKVVTNAQIPVSIGVREGQHFTHLGEDWIVGIRYATPWPKCMDP